MSKNIVKYFNNLIERYRESLEKLWEEGARLNERDREGDLEQLANRINRLNALIASVQEIRQELNTALAWIDKEKKRVRERGWLGRCKKFSHRILGREDEDVASEPDYSGLPDMPDDDIFSGMVLAGLGEYLHGPIILEKVGRVLFTGQTEMKWLKKIEKEMIELLNTGKEPSTRFCAELKTFEKMIAEKREAVMAAKEERKEERLLAAEEEKREWEEARRHSACT